MASIYAKKITFEVTKKGRKYFKIRYSPNHNEFQLVINELTQDFQVGQIVTDLLCTFECKSNGWSQTTTATAVTQESLDYSLQEAEEAERLAEIKRWQGYVESKFPDSIYRKGLEKLKELGFDTSVYADDIAKVHERNRLAEIERWSGYCENAALDGRDYVKGLERLRELGASDAANNYEHQALEVRALRQSAQVEQVERDRQQKADQGIVSYRFCDPSFNPKEELTHLGVGDVYQGWDGQYYKILTRTQRRIWEDGLSFGLADDSGVIVSGNARLATPEEYAQLKAEQDESSRKAAVAAHIRKEHQAIADYIMANGDRPKHSVGETLLSTVTIYGGGSWFEVAPDEIWYCQNNGHDGDDWSLNNVSTWGAGAIGWRIPYEEAIAERIKKLVDLIKVEKPNGLGINDL